MFRFLLNCTIETVEPTTLKENIDDESKQKHLIRCTRTLVGIRTFREAVILPYDEELNEWLFSNAINFFKEVSVIWGFVCITEIPTCEISDGFPKGYEYKFSDGETIKTPIRCSGPGYVDRVLNWVEGQINKFCSRATLVPDNFKDTLKQIYSRLFRIFAIVYSNHFAAIQDLKAVAHLNTSFHHFLIFCWEFEMLRPVEEGALRTLIDEIRRLYLLES